MDNWNLCLAFLGNISRGLTSGEIPEELAEASRQELRDSGIKVIQGIRRSPALDDKIAVVVDSAAGVLTTIIGAIFYDRERALELR